MLKIMLEAIGHAIIISAFISMAGLWSGIIGGGI